MNAARHSSGKVLPASGTAPLLTATDVVVQFPVKGFRKQPFEALHGVSVDIAPGETLGLVGESGSGKTTLGRAILGLVPTASGSITYQGRDITHMSRAGRRSLAGDLQVVFQDPYTSLNPSMVVQDILAEPLTANGMSKKEAHGRIRELLDNVGMPANSGERLPREFSGGQRQRIAIARALALDPALIVCDEPVSALDLSTQARVLDLFIDIQERTGVAYLFISHDLMVVRAISHRIAVMYQGDIVETGATAQVTEHPGHAYTKRLLLAAPIPDPVRQRARRAEFEAVGA